MDFTKILGNPDREPQVDIVTLHGLHRAGGEPWQDTDERPKWLEKDLLQNFDVRVIVFNYEEVEEGLTIYTKRGINLVAQRLLDSIMSWRHSDEESCRPLAFISHDIGGIIAKQGLLLALKHHEKYKSILQSLYAMIFINCPHRLSGHPSISDGLVSLICDTKMPSPGIFEIAKILGSTVIVTNNEFADSTILLHTRVASIYSDHPGYSKRVFDEETATLGIACEATVCLPGDHSTLITGDEGKISHKILRNTLELSTSPGYNVAVWPVSENLEGLRLLNSSSVAQPIYRSREQPITAGVLQFIDFAKWMQQQEDSHRVRWISTGEGHSLHTNSFGSLLQKWGEDPNRPKALIFTCDLSNYRGLPQIREDNDSVTRVVLATQLSQAIAYALPRIEPVKRPKRILDRLADSRGLMDCRCLLDLFDDVNIWLKENNIQAIWGIWNLHKCPYDQQVLLVHRLTKCFEFSEFKPAILFTCKDDSEKKLAHTMGEANVPRFEQVSTYRPSWGSTHIPEVEKLHSLLQGRLELQDLLEEIVKENKETRFISILVRWIHKALENGLASKATEHRIASLLKEVSTRPGRLFQIIIESLRDDQRTRALQILSWVTYSLRPLSPFQLAEALFTMDIESIQGEGASHQTKPDDENAGLYFIYGLLPELQQDLNYMIEIQCNEVRLSHPAISEFLSSHESGAYIDPAEANLHIFKCLLSRISVQAGNTPFVKSSKAQAPPLFPRPYNLAWYAIHYWPQHYIIARKYKSTMQRADKFLKEFLESQRDVVRYWLHVSGGAHPPSTASGDQTSLENLSVLIRSGLYKLGEVQDIFKCSPWDPNVAILESIRCGDLDLLTSLPFDSLDQHQVFQSLEMAAGAKSTVGTMEYLFGKAKDRVPPCIPLPFLFRLVEVGATDTIRIAYESQKPPVPDHGTLLLYAVKSRQQAMIKTLLDLDTVGYSYVLQAMEEACYIGHTALLQPILNIVSLEQRHTIFLHCACVRGNHGAIRKLLQEFDSKNSEHRAQLFGASALAFTTSVTEGFAECTRAILEHCDVNRDQQELREAIMTAFRGAELPQEKTCQLLFDTGVSFTEKQIPSLLRAAIDEGRLDLVKLILSHCGGVNLPHTDDWTPLQTAASLGFLPIVEYLLDMGADIHARNSIGSTPIYIACIENQPQVVSFLLSRGADVTIATTRNWSPLEASFDLPDIIKMIVTKASPKPDYKRITAGAEGYTALWLAVKDNQVESVRLLLDHGDPDLEFFPKSENSSGQAGITALVYAVYSGFDEIVRLLLEKGANVNHRAASIGSGSPIHIASRETTVAVLLEYNPNLEITNSNGLSALNNMVYWHTEPRVPILRRLVNAGADLESGDMSGDTPLCNAVWKENTAAVEYLVSKGAQINLPKSEWGGPLHRAAGFGRLDLLKMLVEMGGDPHMEHNMTGSPLQFACTGPQDKEIAEYLVGELGVRVNTAGGATCTILGQACRTGSLGVLRYLLDNGVNTTAVGRAGLPSVFNLCFREASGTEVLDELLARNVQIWTVRDCLGRSILHAAVMGGSKGLVERLLEDQPGLLQERDRDGWTVLHWAARRGRLWDEDDGLCWPGEDVRKEIIELLLEKGCPGMGERVAIGEKSWTPADLARYHRAPESILEAFSVKELSGGGHSSDQTKDWSCDCCSAEIHGVLYRCKADICHANFGLCFRCIAYREVCHDPEHEFEEIGEGFDD